MNEQFSTTFEDDEAWLESEDQGPDESDDESLFAEDDESYDETTQDPPPVAAPSPVGSEENRYPYQTPTASASDARMRALRNNAIARARYQNRRAAQLANVSSAKVNAIRPATASGSKVLVARTARGVLRMQLKDGIVLANQYNKFVESTTKSLRELRTSELKTRAELAKTTKALASQQASMTSAISAEMGKIQKSAQGELRKEAARVRKLVSDANRRQTLNSLTMLMSVPLFNTYGDRTAPFTSRNLTLLGATLAAMYADDLLQNFTRGNTTRQAATAWSYGAPLLLAGGAHLAFKDSPTAGKFVVHPVQIASGATGSVAVSGIPAKKGSTVVAALGAPEGVTGVAGAGEVDKDGKLTLHLTGTATAGSTALLIIENKT